MRVAAWIDHPQAVLLVPAAIGLAIAFVVLLAVRDCPDGVVDSKGQSLDEALPVGSILWDQVPAPSPAVNRSKVG